MRDIKFRVWDRNNKVMRFPNRSDHDSMWDEGSMLFIGGEPMQFTGLKDKNGKEIYEGDIIKYPSIGNENIQVVEYDSGFCGYRPFCFDDHVVDLYVEDANDVEVIGNIHENPELLKESNE